VSVPFTLYDCCCAIQSVNNKYESTVFTSIAEWMSYNRVKAYIAHVRPITSDEQLNICNSFLLFVTQTV